MNKTYYLICKAYQWTKETTSKLFGLEKNIYEGKNYSELDVPSWLR